MPPPSCPAPIQLAAQAAQREVVNTTTQLIDIFPTVLELADVPAAHWPTLDGHSLLQLMPGQQQVALSTAVDTARPAFVVSQFHGCNIAMSWFLIVQSVEAAAPCPPTQHSLVLLTALVQGASTYKLIVWGTGAEVPSLLFDLEAPALPCPVRCSVELHP